MGSVLYLDRGQRHDERAPGPRRREPESLLRPGYNCWTVARAERVALIIDGEHYFNAFYQAALRARRSITILGWDFNSQTRLHFDTVAPDGPPALLGDFLNYLVRRRRELHVHVLNWDYPMVFGTDREFPPLYGFGWTPSRRVHLRYDDTHPVAGSQHQKVVVIDDAVAFVGGIDLTVRRWDTTEHLPGDPRRVAYGKPYPPFHDLMVAVDGEAAQQLGVLTRERWLNATGEKLKAAHFRPRNDHDPWPETLKPQLAGIDVGFARTIPPSGDTPAVREVEKLYLDMIAAARDSMYIENQYFTAPRIAAAIEKRLAEPNGPEVVLVVRLLSHGWLEEHTMHVLRTRLIRRLQQADRHDHLRVYYPHIPGLDEGCCLDVHSKVMIVDDRILRVGSANLCNRSMGLDTECDAVIESRGNAEVAAVISDFRDQLLAEHLNVPLDRLREEIVRHHSLHRAIDALAGDGRSLKRLEELPQWSETVLQVAAVADPDEPIALDFLRSDRFTEDGERKQSPAWGKLLLLVLLVAGLTALWRLTPLAELVTAERTIAWAKDFGSKPWAPVALMLAYTPASLVMFPRPLITLAAVIAFGPWLGFAYALMGIVASSITTYYMGRKMRRDTVRRIAGPKLDRMIEVLKKHGLLAMTLLRLVPLAPFAVESIVAGAIRMKVWHVALGTAIGLLPGTLATTVFGDAIETALSGSGNVNWWLVGGVVLVFIAGIWAVRRWFVNMERRMSADAAVGRKSS